MGRRRRSDRHLPAKVYLEHGAYYFRDGKKPRVPLGRDLAGALAKYATLIGPVWSLRTLGDIIDRYRIEVLPLKRSAQTRKEQAKSLERLKLALGHFLPDNITPVHLYTYMDARRSKDSTVDGVLIPGRDVPVAARHEAVLLGHVYKKAKRWGAASINPATGLELPKKAAKRQYVPMTWVDQVRALATPHLRLAIDWAIMIGQRRADLLKLKWVHVRKDGIYVQQGKTAAQLLIARSVDVNELLARSKGMKPDIPCEFLIRRRNGRPYTNRGFSSNWQRVMAKHVAARRPAIHFPRPAFSLCRWSRYG